MSFTRCLPASVMLLLLFSMLLNPELLNFGYSVHCLSHSWHEEWKAAHKKEMHVALPVDFWLLSATTVTLEALSWSPEGRGPGAGGACRGKWARWDAGALPLVPTSATCAPTPCPTTHPLCAPPPRHQEYVYPDTCTEDRHWVWWITGRKNPFPIWYPQLYGKPPPSCASALLLAEMNTPNKSHCVLAPQSRGCWWTSSADGTGWHHALELSS